MQIKMFDYGCKTKPTRKYPNDAGADCYLLDDLILYPHETKKTPLGFGIELPTGYMAFLMPRSSSARDGVTIFSAPIDSSYSGEIFAIIANSTNEVKKYKKGERICQLVITPVITAEFVDDIELRGNNGFGSSGK